LSQRFRPPREQLTYRQRRRTVANGESRGGRFCTRWIDRNEAAVELFGKKHQKYGKRFLERDASTSRRVPYTKVPGSRLPLYHRGTLRRLREEGRVNATSNA
jgi:hypothetical protein